MFCMAKDDRDSAAITLPMMTACQKKIMQRLKPENVEIAIACPEADNREDQARAEKRVELDCATQGHRCADHMHDEFDQGPRKR